MDDADRRLISLIQRPLPFHLRPFDVLAERLCVSTDECLERLENLKTAGTILGLKAFLDGQKMGCQSSVVAMRFPGDGVEDGAPWVNSHPGVLRSYRRSHAFNFWFTLTLPLSESMEEHIRKLHLLSGAYETLMLPAIKKYRQGALDSGETLNMPRNFGKRSMVNGGLRQKFQPFTSREYLVMESLSAGFPLRRQPYLCLGGRLGMSEQECFEIVRLFHRRGYLRKIAAPAGGSEGTSPIRHWLAIDVPEERESGLAEFLLSLPGILCCYKRPAYAVFPYSLYAGLDGSCLPGNDLPKGLAARLGEWPWVLLTNLKEYKRKSFSFLDGELRKWRENCPVTLDVGADDGREEGLLLYRNR